MNSDFFALTAQLGLGIAGFSGVIVALESRDLRHWDPVRRRSLRILLQLSGMVVAFSLVPLVAYRVADSPEFWKWALGLYGVAHIADAGSFIVYQPAGSRVAPAYAGMAVGIGQVIAAIGGSVAMVEVVYLVSLVWQLGGAAMGFVFLLWARGSTSDVEAADTAVDVSAGAA
jgi:hypothetical protein